MYCVVEAAPILPHYLLHYIILYVGWGPHPPALYVVLYCIVCWRGSPSSCIARCTILNCVAEGVPVPLHCTLHYIVLCGGRGTPPPALYVILYFTVWWRGPPSSCIVYCTVLFCVAERAPIPLHCVLRFIVLCRERGSHSPPPYDIILCCEGGTHPPALYVVFYILYGREGPHPRALYVLLLILYCMLYYVIFYGGGGPHVLPLHVALYCIVWWRGPPSSCIVRCIMLDHGVWYGVQCKGMGDPSTRQRRMMQYSIQCRRMGAPFPP